MAARAEEMVCYFLRSKRINISPSNQKQVSSWLLVLLTLVFPFVFTCWKLKYSNRAVPWNIRKLIASRTTHFDCAICHVHSMDNPFELFILFCTEGCKLAYFHLPVTPHCFVECRKTLFKSVEFHRWQSKIHCTCRYCLFSFGRDGQILSPVNLNPPILVESCNT